MARRASSGVYAAKARNHKPSLVRRVADHPLFEAVVYVAIIINAFLLASTAGEEDIKCTNGTYIAELCIFSVYLLELVVKLGAYGIDYFADGWNRLDFLVLRRAEIIRLDGAELLTGQFSTHRSCARASTRTSSRGWPSAAAETSSRSWRCCASSASSSRCGRSRTCGRRASWSPRCSTRPRRS